MRFLSDLRVFFYSSIRAVAVDGLSQLLVSGGADSKLVIWHIKTKKVLKSITLDSAVCKMRLHEDSAMVAVGLDDFSLVVVDLETKRVVRRFPGKTSYPNICLTHSATQSKRMRKLPPRTCAQKVKRCVCKSIR